MCLFNSFLSLCSSCSLTGGTELSQGQNYTIIVDDFIGKALNVKVSGTLYLWIINEPLCSIINPKCNCSYYLESYSVKYTVRLI